MTERNNSEIKSYESICASSVKLYQHTGVHRYSDARIALKVVTTHSTEVLASGSALKGGAHLPHCPIHLGEESVNFFNHIMIQMGNQRQSRESSLGL